MLFKLEILMMRKINYIKSFFAVFILAVSLFVSAQNNTAFTIVSAGRSTYKIVIPNNATTLEKTAAKELQEYLKKATKAVLPIVNEKHAKGKNIYIGNTNYARRNKIADVRPEAWMIKAHQNNLVLTGGAQRGVLYAVYHFLEKHLDIRWYDPWEEDVPQWAQLSLPVRLEEKGNPTFWYRDLYDSIFDDDGIDPKPTSAAYSLYQARNRLNGHFSYTPQAYGGRITYGKPYHVHTFNRYFPGKKYFKEHPEWYAWSKKKQMRIDSGQICLSNKELLEVFKQKVRDSIQASYDKADKKGQDRPLFFSVSLNDVEGICECDECVATYTRKGLSGYAFAYVNKIADYIAPIFPKAKIETLAYWQYRVPPLDDTKPAKNVVVRIAEDYKDNMHDINNPNNKEVLERLKVWQRLCDNDNLFIWDYYLNYSNASNSSPFRFRSDMHIYKAHGVQGIFGEIEWPLVADLWNMRVWMLAKLYEDMNLDTDTLVHDFVTHYYGPAAKQMLEFLYMVKEKTDETNSAMTFRTSLFSEKFMDLDAALKGHQLFEAALQAVKDSEKYSRRVRHARTTFDRYLVRRFRPYILEAQKRNIDIRVLNRKAAAQRIVDALKEQAAFKVMDEKTKKEIGLHEQIVAQK